MLDDFLSGIAKRLVDRTLDQCSRWASHRIWLPKPYSGYMTYEKFPWIKEILDIDRGLVSIKKGSQMGLSVAAMVKSLFIICEKKDDCLYVLPTDKLVSDFSKGRLEPLIDNSPELTNIWKEANVGFRQTRAGNSLYIRGSKAEANLVSIPLGHAVVDEYDRCNTNTLALVMKRFSAREEFYFMALSTPTLPEFGIDEVYKQGTQEKFKFPCPNCGQRIELIWPDSVEICGEHYQDEDCARSRFLCTECGGTLPHENKSDWLKKAIWVPTHQVEGHRSFHINQLYSPGMDAEKIVREFLKGEISEVSRIEFFNQTLGECYVMDGARITPDIIARNLGNYSKRDARPQDSSRMITMGVDPGAFLDIVVSEFVYDREPGNEPHLNSVCKVLWEGRLAGNDWHGLDKLMNEWQIQHCCLDSSPETVVAKEFARRFRGFVSLVQYRQGTAGDEIKVSEDENGVPTLTVDRTAFMDMSLGRFHKDRIKLPQDASATFKEHLQSPVRTYEINDDGRPRAVYHNNSDDHGAHALLFSEVAHFRAYSRATGRTIRTDEGYFNF